jgi:quercetin dioxygenase-like cupin family protein
MTDTPPALSLPLAPADPGTFTGSAFSALLGAAGHETAVRLYYVRFEPGARTHWHTHSGVQILVVRAGRCRYQREGDEVREAAAGESVRFEPGQRHWHGATASAAAEHVAVNLAVDATTWQEPVSEEVFAGERSP